MEIVREERSLLFSTAKEKSFDAGIASDAPAAFSASAAVEVGASTIISENNLSSLSRFEFDQVSSLKNFLWHQSY